LHRKSRFPLLKDYGFSLFQLSQYSRSFAL